MCAGSQVRVCAVPSLPESDESKEGQGEETGGRSKKCQLFYITKVSITKQTLTEQCSLIPKPAKSCEVLKKFGGFYTMKSQLNKRFLVRAYTWQTSPTSFPDPRLLTYLFLRRGMAKNSNRCLLCCYGDVLWQVRNMEVLILVVEIVNWCYSTCHNASFLGIILFLFQLQLSQMVPTKRKKEPRKLK